MTLRIATFFAATALIGAPAAAQDYSIETEAVYDDGVVYDDEVYPAGYQADDAYQGEWRGDWIQPDRYEGVWQGTYDADLDRRPYAPHLAYTARERAVWLQRCRATFYDDAYGYDYDRGPDGAVVGGVIGAVAGGVIGNRVADGSRLGGTLLGAGLGGLAGAAIGDAVDGDEPRIDPYVGDYCESYLSNYEARAAYAAPQQRLRRVIRRPVSRACDCAEAEQVIEEVVVVDEPDAVSRPVVTKTVRRTAAPTGKTTRLRSAK